MFIETQMQLNPRIITGILPLMVVFSSLNAAADQPEEMTPKQSNFDTRAHPLIPPAIYKDAQGNDIVFIKGSEKWLNEKGNLPNQNNSILAITTVQPYDPDDDPFTLKNNSTKIIYNAEFLAKFSSLHRQFWIAHELGHSQLNHTNMDINRNRMVVESDADCFALKYMVQNYRININQAQAMVRQLPIQDMRKRALGFCWASEIKPNIELSSLEPQ